MGGGDGERSNDDEYAGLLAESCWTFTLATRSDGSEGGGDVGGGYRSVGNSFGLADGLGQDRETRTTEGDSMEEIELEIEVERHCHEQRHQGEGSTASVQEGVDGRLQLLLSVTELIDCAAEEIVSGMSVRVTPRGVCYENIVRRMSERLWILAQRRLRDLDDRDRRKEIRWEGSSRTRSPAQNLLWFV